MIEKRKIKRNDFVGFIVVFAIFVGVSYVCNEKSFTKENCPCIINDFADENVVIVLTRDSILKEVVNRDWYKMERGDTVR